jgi:hypothetical protein
MIVSTGCCISKTSSDSTSGHICKTGKPLIQDTLTLNRYLWRNVCSILTSLDEFYGLELSCNLWSLDIWSLLWSSNCWFPGYDTAGHAIASLCSISFWCCKMQSAELSMFNLLWVLWWWHCIHMHSCCPVSQTAFLDNEFEFCVVCEFWFPFVWLCLGGGGTWVFVQFVDSFSRYTYCSQCLGDKIVNFEECNHVPNTFFSSVQKLRVQVLKTPMWNNIEL